MIVSFNDLKSEISSLPPPPLSFPLDIYLFKKRGLGLYGSHHADRIPTVSPSLLLQLMDSPSTTTHIKVFFFLPLDCPI